MTSRIDKNLHVYSNLQDACLQTPDGTWSIKAPLSPLPELRVMSDVLLDYLVIGFYVEDKETRNQGVEMARDASLRWGRYRVEGSVIYLDEKKIGYITGSKGAPSKYGYKLKVYFTGTFFRPVELGGCGLDEREASRIAHVWVMSLKYGVPMVRALIELRAAEQRHEEQGYPSVGLRHVGKARAKVRYLEQKEEGGQGPVPEFEPRFVSIDRVDYAVEVQSNDAGLQFDLPLRWYEYGKRGVDMLFSGFTYARTSIESYKGITVYCGTSEEPLKQRGKRTLMRVYQYRQPQYSTPARNEYSEQRRSMEADRSRIVRIETEHPKVVNVGDKGMKDGPLEAALHAAQLIAEALGYRKQSLPVARREDQEKGLHVPIVDISKVWGRNELRASFVTERAFYGHAANESRRIAKSGMKCLSNQLFASLLIGAADSIAKNEEVPQIPLMAESPITEDEADDLINLLMVFRHYRYGKNKGLTETKELIEVLQEEGFGSLLPPYVSGGMCARTGEDCGEVVESARTQLLCNEGRRLRRHRRDLAAQSTQIDQLTHMTLRQKKRYFEEEVPELSLRLNTGHFST